MDYFICLFFVIYVSSEPYMIIIYLLHLISDPFCFCYKQAGFEPWKTNIQYDFKQFSVETKIIYICSQVGEVMPFIDELLASINTIICDLQPQQVSFAKFSLLLELSFFSGAEGFILSNLFLSPQPSLFSPPNIYT